jgi:hypothetical protein
MAHLTPLPLALRPFVAVFPQDAGLKADLGHARHIVAVPVESRDADSNVRAKLLDRNCLLHGE